MNLAACEDEVKCTHVYDNDLDGSCNLCGESREIPPCASSENIELTYGMIEYFTNSFYSNWYSQYYYYILIGYVNFDVNKPFDEQYTDSSNTQTYYDYFKDGAKSQINTLIKYCEAAMDDTDINYNELKAKAEEYASKQIEEKMDSGIWFGLSEKDVRSSLIIEYIASEYSNLVKDRIHGSITDEEIEEYYDVETMGEKDETLLRNVGHILFKVDTNAYKTREEALDAALKVLDELKSKEINGIVEKEVFGELGKEYTYDSNVFYDNVKMGEMIQPFEEWLFAATTKGEIGLIETVYGIHIMYYGGETVPAWKFRAREELTNEKMQKWFISLEYSVTIPDNIFESILLK